MVSGSRIDDPYFSKHLISPHLNTAFDKEKVETDTEISGQ